MPIPIEVLVTVGTAALAIIGAAAYSIVSGNRASVDFDDDGNDELTFSGDPTQGEQIETEPSPYNPDDADSESEDPSTTEQTSDRETGDISNTEFSSSHLESVTGIGPVRAEDFRSAGYLTKSDLRNATDSELLDVTGIGPRALEQIRSDIGVNTPRDE